MKNGSQVVITKNLPQLPNWLLETAELCGRPYPGSPGAAILGSLDLSSSQHYINSHSTMPSTSITAAVVKDHVRVLIQGSRKNLAVLVSKRAAVLGRLRERALELCNKPRREILVSS